MIPATVATLSGLLLFAAASGSDGETTCHKLSALYRANVDATADALRLYKGCVQSRSGADACALQFWDFRSAQEGLQASFASFAKACGAALALRGENPHASTADRDDFTEGPDRADQLISAAELGRDVTQHRR